MEFSRSSSMFLRSWSKSVGTYNACSFLFGITFMQSQLGHWPQDINDTQRTLQSQFSA